VQSRNACTLLGSGAGPQREADRTRLEGVRKKARQLAHARGTLRSSGCNLAAKIDALAGRSGTQLRRWSSGGLPLWGPWPERSARRSSSTAGVPFLLGCYRLRRRVETRSCPRTGLPTQRRLNWPSDMLCFAVLAAVLQRSPVIRFFAVIVPPSLQPLRPSQRRCDRQRRVWANQDAAAPEFHPLVSLQPSSHAAPRTGSHARFGRWLPRRARDRRFSCETAGRKQTSRRCRLGLIFFALHTALADGGVRACHLGNAQLSRTPSAACFNNFPAAKSHFTAHGIACNDNQFSNAAAGNTCVRRCHVPKHEEPR